MECTRAHNCSASWLSLVDVNLMITDNEEGCKKLEEHAGRQICWCCKSNRPI